MPAKYCTSSKCGAKTEYSIKAPRFCSSCGLEFSKAFLGASASTPIVSSPEPIKKIASHKHRRPPQNIDDQGDDGEDFFDADDVQMRAQELAASIRSDITVKSGPTFGVRLGDLLQNPEKFTDVGQRSAEIPNLPEAD